MRGSLAGIVLLVAAWSVQGASARAEPLTVDQVVVLARTRSPEARLALTRVAEARARLTGARVFSVDNPVIEGVSGSGSESGRTTAMELTVPLGLGFRRSGEISEARAGLEREGFLETDSQLRVVAAALGAYYRTLHAQQRSGIAADRRALARELVRIAADRLEAGDAAHLEVVVAETELSRAESEVLVEQGNVTEAILALARILGLPTVTELEVVGELGDRSLLDAATRVALEQRADVSAAESDLRAASAALSVARTSGWPAVALRVNYEHTRDEEVISPGLALSLPFFNRGQGARGEAVARRDRAAVELETRRSAASSEAAGARLGYASIEAAAREMEERALPRALEVEELAQQSYGAGKLDLPGLLVVRSGSLDTRREHADRLLEAAERGIELTLAVGVLPREH